MFQNFVVIMFNSWCIEYLYWYMMHMKLTCPSCIFSLPVDVRDLQSYISSLCKFWMHSPVFPVFTCLHISCQMDFINFSQMKYGLLHATALNFSPVIFHCIPLSGLDYCGIIKIYRANFHGLWVFLLMRRNVILWSASFQFQSEN